MQAFTVYQDEQQQYDILAILYLVKIKMEKKKFPALSWIWS